MSAVCAHLEPIRIRLAREDDAAAIYDLILIAGDEPPDFPVRAAEGHGALVHLEKRRAALRHQHFAVRHALLAELGGTVCGVMLGYRISRHLEAIRAGLLPASLRPAHDAGLVGRTSFYINTLACYPQFRNLGIGGQLLAEAEAWALRCKCRMLSLEVASGNAPALAFYERRGFTVKPTNTRPETSVKPTACVLMVRPLQRGQACELALRATAAPPAEGRARLVLRAVS